MDNNSEFQPSGEKLDMQDFDEIDLWGQPYKEAIRKCVAGLTGYAACLAAQHRDEQVKKFRQLITEMDDLWYQIDGDAPADQEATQEFEETFDAAVYAARDSRNALMLSEQTKKDIIDGLKLYAYGVQALGDLSPWAGAPYERLAKRLQDEWREEAQAEINGGKSPSVRQILNTPQVPNQTHDQPNGKVSYTLDEYLAKIEPQYRAYKDTMRKCIDGLTEHAAHVAAQHHEEQIPTFRRLIIEMAEFWGLTDDDTPKGMQEMVQRYGQSFDAAVSAARDSGNAPELSEQAKGDILAGLELYAQEMTDNGDMEQWVTECEILAEDLQVEWQIEAAQSRQASPILGGMS